MCKNCDQDKVISVNAKCSDMCTITHKDKELDGYVPSDIGIGGDDYIRFDLCLACGQVQGEFPVDMVYFNSLFEGGNER